MALTKVIGNGLGTLGDGTANDTKIVFDGNAQDFHIGLDDSADSLTIGLGSTLGTTSHMVIDSTGAITKPLQPAFLVMKSGAQSDIATGSGVNMTWDTERFDQNGDFASNTFTAPVTGKYLLAYNLYVNNLDSASNYYESYLWTSNRLYYTTIDPDFGQDNVYFSFVSSQVADMDAGDTAYVGINQQSGTSQTDIATVSTFSGCLLA